MNANGLKETFKSFLRFLYFGVLGLVGTFLTSLLTNEDLLNTVINIGGVYLPVGVVIISAITAIVKAIDLYVRNNDKNNLKGIAPKVLQG